ncbi:hypothetical protein [Paenarthrobacter sp. YJN-5]|nr:hypothetical protein [Paenarthrobacter sp. YJN-5]QOT19637.1 hypothetical protein HMI59_23780 [Paenarthrobacter sp. YJN-5]
MDENFMVPTLDNYATWLEEKAAEGEGGFGTPHPGQADPKVRRYWS